MFDVRNTLAKAAGKVFGKAALPFFDLGNSDLILSFGANFLETYLSPVAYARGYSSMRRGGTPAGNAATWSNSSRASRKPARQPMNGSRLLPGTRRVGRPWHRAGSRTSCAAAACRPPTRMWILPRSPETSGIEPGYPQTAGQPFLQRRPSARHPGRIRPGSQQWTGNRAGHPGSERSDPKSRPAGWRVPDPIPARARFQSRLPEFIQGNCRPG